MAIVKHFEKTSIAEMELSSQVVVEETTSVRETVLAMAEANSSCAFVMNGTEISGIFTEHDVTHRVVRSPDVWDSPVAMHMTPDPHIIDPNASAMDALRLMRAHRFRNLPVRLGDGEFANVTHYDLIALASAFLDSESKDPAEFSAEHVLRFVDFYGMPSRVPLEVTADTTLYDTVNLMVESDRGLVSIVDDRGVVIGEFTQHDVFRKVACRVQDLIDEVVGEWMTTENMATSLASAKIADGLHEMAAKRHRYLLLVNETGRSVGIVTFRDIADYFDAAFSEVPQ
ncbi:MAG: CBS domain-containing protein [Acidimicrobiales bacterium]|nr:CBS domain-containing protein [Acidimicrobiales bacterium]